MPEPDDRVFVLVPGAGGRAWYWHRVVEELERRGHTAVAVDLPADDPDAGLEAYADVIVDAADGHDHVVVVGQSMGALSAILAADRLPTDLLVLVNAMVPLPGETGGQWWGATAQPAARAELAAAEGRTVTDDVDALDDFFHDVPDDVTRAAMDGDEPTQSERPFADPFPLRQWPGVPTRVVTGRDDRFFPADFQRRVAEDRLGLTPDVVPGGHLVALSQPGALVDQFETHLAALDRRQSTRAAWAIRVGDVDHGYEADQHLRDLEAALWHEDTRFDHDWMDRVLHPDFVEFGQSGRTLDRAATIAVEARPIGVELPLRDLVVDHPAPGVALLTYEVVDGFGPGGSTRHAKRSSLWVRSADGWRLRFHQATPVPDA